MDHRLPTFLSWPEYEKSRRARLLDQGQRERAQIHMDAKFTAVH